MRVLMAMLGVVFLACVAGAAEAQSVSPAARQVLARAQAVSGGAAGWNQLRGVHETGEEDGVRYERWLDPLRWGARVETHEPAGLRVHGFNGFADWQILPDGRIVGVDDRATLVQARTAAFFAVHGFFYPSRFPANATHLGARQSGGRSFDVLSVEVLGGETRELWFDRRTGLPARIVDRTGAGPVTVELSDYRRVGPVLWPFRAVSDRGGRPVVRQAESVVPVQADRAMFSWSRTPAAPPASAAP